MGTASSGSSAGGPDASAAAQGSSSSSSTLSSPESKIGSVSTRVQLGAYHGYRWPPLPCLMAGWTKGKE